jgi:hypothetical protein
MINKRNTKFIKLLSLVLVLILDKPYFYGVAGEPKKGEESTFLTSTSF